MSEDPERPIIHFDQAKRDQLRRAYNRAVSDKRETFEFGGRPLLTSYAKYVLEYLDMRLGE